MQFKLQLVARTDNGQADDVNEIVVFDKACELVEQFGLTLAQAKALLQANQRVLLEQQTTAFLGAHAVCPCCKQLGSKGHHTITYRTLFGKIKLVSPRFRTYRCQPHTNTSFSPQAALFTERTAPELQFMETKWASLVSYSLTVKALQDSLPVDARMNASTMCNHTLKIAQRCEAAWGAEPIGLSADEPEASKARPAPKVSITVGIDDSYLRHWGHKQQRFEVMVGKVVPPEQAAKCFGLVRTYNTMPKRQLFNVLKSQGLQPQQALCFLSDGEASVRQLQMHLHPRSDHLLDWFHLTMRISVLGQFVQGLMKLDLKIRGELEQGMDRLKWKLWDGKATTARDALADIKRLMGVFAESYPKFTALTKHVHEFQRYLERNQHLIVDYGRWQVISTAFVESLVNSLLDKRFDKKQQLQWTPEASSTALDEHESAQQRAGSIFKLWYPDFTL